MACPSDRSLKTGVAGPDPALRGLCECSHTDPYAALPKEPRALAEGLGLGFQRPAKTGSHSTDGLHRAFFLAIAALVAAALSGCVSMQVQKARRGVDPVPLAAGLAPGASTLQDALARCGAPDEIVDMDPDFALHYRHLLQRGAKLSVGIPLKQVFLPNPSLESRGNLVRTDALVLVFTPAGILKDMRHEQATDRPLIEDYWQ